MKLSELLQGLEHEIIQEGTSDDISGVTIDSRKVSEGFLYACIRGFRVDGHKFISDAVKSGAAAVLVDSSQTKYPEGVSVIKVNETRTALCVVSSNFFGRPAETMRIIGVTGTNGKTSTAYFLETILKASGRRTGVIGTIGTRVGDAVVDIPFDASTTPDTLELMQILARMRELGVEDVVMEVSSHALSLNKVDGIKFAAGLFTNLTQDHLDFHGSMENYRSAKSRLFDLCKIGIVNADDASAKFMMKSKKCAFLTYGIDSECDLKATRIDRVETGMSFSVEIDGEIEDFFISAKGRFNIYNCLAAICAALALGAPVDRIKQGVSMIRAIPGRIQSIPNEGGFYVLVDYAHSPDGLVSVINAVREFTKGRVITLFGCGGDKDKGKRPIMGRIAGELSDYCVLTSDNPRSEEPAEIIRQIESGLSDTNCGYETHPNRREAIFAGVSMLKPGDSLI
ncbi:MAG: UDP-N-acetylmuramoyl-L-alanyl-D-glutamate--2,6-diaminopimelate ligase, partial [Defluviitaleaceae bacterium]|nr:UDP-N-acetylmuramoyl-L-alanyl-D-glutamate--2,6-diaminopimelate ligase [Defluviitaleaceae bacterium]